MEANTCCADDALAEQPSATGAVEQESVGGDKFAATTEDEVGIRRICQVTVSDEEQFVSLGKGDLRPGQRRTVGVLEGVRRGACIHSEESLDVPPTVGRKGDLAQRVVIHHAAADSARAQLIGDERC